MPSIRFASSMKPQAVIVLVAVLPLVGGCLAMRTQGLPKLANPSPRPAPSATPVDVAAARVIVERGMRQAMDDGRPLVLLEKAEIHFETDRASYEVMYKGVGWPVKGQTWKGSGTVLFHEPITSYECDDAAHCSVNAGGSLGEIGVVPERDVVEYVDAFNSLVAAQEAEFARSAAAWQGLSEAGDRERILAENAFREKDTASALTHYEAGLSTDPAWPDGNFNAALLHADQGEYLEAVREMKRYLVVVPNASDSTKAREKIIVWEEKAKTETKTRTRTKTSAVAPARN